MSIKLVCIENLVNPGIVENVASEPTRFAQLRIWVTYELEEHNETQYKILGPAFALGYIKWQTTYPIFNKTYFAESIPEKTATKEVAWETIAVDDSDLPF